MHNLIMMCHDTKACQPKMCHGTLSLYTDYDCRHEGEEDVTAEIVLQNIMKNVDTAKAIIKHAIPMIESERGCACVNASSNAIVTHKENIPSEVKERLNVIFGKYL